MAESSLATLPQELKDRIGRYLDLKSIARAQLASKGIRVFLPTERLALNRHSRVWESIIPSKYRDEDLWNRFAEKCGGDAKDYDMVLLGSDLEFLYYADDGRKKPPPEYGPLHLFLRIVRYGGGDYNARSFIFEDRFSPEVTDQCIILHTSDEKERITVSDVWNLGITRTSAVFCRLNLDLHRVSVGSEVTGGYYFPQPYCTSTFQLHQVPGSRLRPIKINGGMPQRRSYGYEDDEVTKHLKQMIETLHRMARQNDIKEC
jgi:hypothetical protein